MQKPYHQILRESITECVRVRTQLERALCRSESTLREAEMDVRCAFYRHLNARTAPLAQGVMDGYSAVFGGMPFSDKSRVALLQFVSQMDASWDFIREGSPKAYRFNWTTVLPTGYEQLGRILESSHFGLHFAAAFGAHTASGRKQLASLASQAVGTVPTSSDDPEALARQISAALTEGLAMRGLVQHGEITAQDDAVPADTGRRYQSTRPR